ncbi:uncharacterized protein N7482_009728 [Penicillium canariense]|uniref:Ras-GEF domain-containing protein n=1 Tax=Penicillium canariense TaxID=189055 RepID=A0A9W9HRE2_9EURO|nr:uncharacterized protein N7482_009728 [Penicillium canariense]KAJ5153250.1 hypothetical protein N7482_009728 [Penicillium canariense]
MSQAISPRTGPPESILSYPTLFQPSAEFPRFAVPYRWWEDEATTVLWAFNIPEISQVIRYGLFRDENFPRSSLLSRNADTIDAFLVAMAEPREHQRLGNLSHVQRVEEILRRSSNSPFQPVPWTWFPPQPGHSLDARAIAGAIEAESHLHFRRLPFEEIVRASLGYPAISVEWFLLQHTVFFIYLSNHLQIYPEEIPLYIEAEKSPFAHRALMQCIRTLRPDATRDMPQPTTPGFEFIAGPVQLLFKDQPPSLTTILKIFSVLAIRFRRQYIHTAKMEWHRPFDTTILFLEDCLNSSSPKDLARTMTETAELEFSGLSRQHITANDAFVREILANWHSLSISVWECCAALPEIAPYLRECAQALLNAKNYHSLTALSDGLYRYNATTARSRGLNSTVGGMVVLDAFLPPDVIILTNPAQNYTSYRHHYGENPGLPFLIPHLRDFQQHGESALQPLLQYLQNPMSAEK